MIKVFIALGLIFFLFFNQDNAWAYGYDPNHPHHHDFIALNEKGHKLLININNIIMIRINDELTSGIIYIVHAEGAYAKYNKIELDKTELAQVIEQLGY